MRHVLICQGDPDPPWCSSWTSKSKEIQERSINLRKCDHPTGLLKMMWVCWSVDVTTSSTPLTTRHLKRGGPKWGRRVWRRTLPKPSLRNHAQISQLTRMIVYSDSMSCLQAIEGEDTGKHFICHIIWLLNDKGTHIRFCWIPSHCGIDGNERVDQLANETLDHDMDPLVGVHCADLKPQVNSYIQQLAQIKWDVAVHGRDLYFVKPTLGPPKKFQHLARAEEVVITRLRIGHTKATKSHILSRGPSTTCHHCGQTLAIDHMLLECAVLQECRDEYYTADSLNTLFETIPETCIVEFLREVGFFYLIWRN